MLLSFVAVALAALQGTSSGVFYSEGRDPIDDTLQVAAIFQSDDGARVSVACDHSRSRTIFVTFESDRFLAVAPSALVEGLMPFKYRIDDKPAQSAFSRYGTSVAMLEGAEARAFAERMAGGTRLHVRVLGASGDIDASFDATGAEQAISRLAQSCGDRRLQKRLAREP